MGSGRSTLAQLKDRRMPPKGKRGRPKKGEEKKQRKKKDPNAPKRPMSAYFLFMNATRPTVRKENPDASIGEVAKILGKMWGEIEPEDKAKYDKDAAAAKKKWEAEKAAYAKKGKAAAPAAESGDEEDEEEGKPRTANRKIEPRVKRNQSLAKLQIRPRGGVAEARTLFNAIF